MFIERIFCDEQFILDAIDKATAFIKIGILPELVGKWYTKQHMSPLPSNN